MSDHHPPRYDPRDRFPVGLPASGAWMPGDPVGERRFVTVTDARPFALEGGGRLDRIDVAYQTWGELSAAGDNAVLVCHAPHRRLHAAGPMAPGHRSVGWWDDLIGPGRAIDTDRWFVVCSNVLGGCQGTTGPASIDPATGAPFGPRFPRSRRATWCGCRPCWPTGSGSVAGSRSSAGRWAACRCSSGEPCSRRGSGR